MYIPLCLIGIYDQERNYAANKMKPHQQIVVDEKTELDEKRIKLDSFFDNAIFEKLPQEEKNRLRKQSEIMDQYSNILSERIGAFEQ